MTFQRGHDLPEPQRRPGKIPVIGSFGITGYHDTATTKAPGVTVGRSGASFGAVNYSPIDFWALNTALYVTNFHNNDERFAYYFLKSIDLQRYNSGSAQPSLNRNFIHPIPVKVPPLNEQKAIAQILSSLDDKIELNQQMNQTLEAIARALFKSWFIDFDPVRAKMDDRQPAGMDAETAALFPAEFEDSAIGKIPKGWKVDALSSLIEIMNGGTPKTSISGYWNGEILWYAVTDSPDPSNVFVIDTAKKITQLGLENSTTRLLPSGTTIISARGTVGKCALTPVVMAMNQTCYGIKGRNGRGDYWTYFSVTSAVLGLKQSSHGTVFDAISRDTFRQIFQAVPPIELSAQFEKLVSPGLSKILSSLYESRSLAEIRDRLLPKLLSGELRVKDAAAIVEHLNLR